jgi:heptosyltransferase II
MTPMRKILAIRNDRFGEFLLNIPVFRAVKETYPGVKLHVVVAPSVKDIAKAVPFIDKVIARRQNTFFLEDLAFLFRMKFEAYDAALVLNPSKRWHHMVSWATIPLRAGYARKHHFMLNRTVADNKGLGKRHEVDCNLDVAALIGAFTKDKSLTLNIPDALRESVVSKFGLLPQERLIAVHPWTSDPVKQWPLENFEELVRRLAAAFTGKIIIIGKPEKWHEAVKFPSGVIDLTGKTTLLEAAAILTHCRCLVSCDSGPVHLAASVGTPVVALFRNDMPGKNPERWGPWGKGHAVIQKAKIGEITVEDVQFEVGSTAYGEKL